MPYCKFLEAGSIFTIVPNETIMNAASRAGVQLPYRCVSGHHGLCRLLLDRREIKTVSRSGDPLIHKYSESSLPCCHFPMHDVGSKNQ
ncbi:2Fe-2S iron-sulfur cluster binding domain-containing protein [Pantoea endophytica]|uniref:2Fe-2S iron-sulfur cluster-binding protein n=1 Tax=Pantoea sp. BJ2 TaxID=3141322 RepID=UPI00330642DB